LSSFAVTLVVNGENLRKKLIEKGVDFANELTAGRQAQRIADIVYKSLRK